ncbi:phosphoenolpyruvate--protein phosphotransferase [Chromobacterium violaceum]|uniref:Multiphosphoryl transfer protein 1 n=1 Tax=Chromobacterium violaceum TaxID=536 RepID=A0AAX2M7H0_CHRVL|nr:phosphoenolpyruvate--protein phosphotransferase [Chromobacterium violaceum]OLZ74882.1 phosphoenolpyruvate--protein phosphotransferase [Chromobacterium violaceum]STB63676.1 Multiphosphoryl transfer protein 1 [Chromobacterium violaceum]SUX32538.1 Multiphosphoryl transfer protein 1 [Chromobacterium violaceum]
MSHSLTLVCPLPNGIHARPASRIAEFCAGFGAAIRWRNQRNGQLADAKSVLSLIGGDILFNDVVDIEIDGEEAARVAAELGRFLKQTLPLCDEPLAAAPAASRALPRGLAELAPSPCFGQPAGQGVAIGELCVYRGFRLPEPAELPLSTGRDAEIAALEGARRTLAEQLRMQAEREDGEAAAVSRAHLAILRDPDFRDRLDAAVDDGAGAARAVAAAVAHYRAQLARSASEYLREREVDIRDVGRRLLDILAPVMEPAGGDFPPATLLWAEDLAPSELLALDRSRVKGLLLARGGLTSHTIILARAFSLPVLTGVQSAAIAGGVGRTAVLDAGLGALFQNPDERVLDYYRAEEALLAQQRQKLAQACAGGSVSADGQRLELAVNIASAAEAQLGFAQGADGVGLFRTEMLFMEADEPPGEEAQFQCYAEVVRLAAGRPVIIRTFDIGGDKPAPCFPAAQESNPFLGYRAIRMYPDQEAAFRTQLRAILRASALGPVKAMIPMIATLNEARWARRVLEEERAALGLAEAVPMGIMLEVPSVLFQLDAFCREVDFFSVGSNDLTQYLFAADRDNERVGQLYDSLHPAFLAALNQAVATIHRHGRWIGLCGEAAAAPHALPLFLGMGLDELSMSAPSLQPCRRCLRGLDAGRCRELLAQALACADGAEVRALVDSAATRPALPMLTVDCLMPEADWRSKAAVIKGMVDRLWLLERCDDRYGMEEDLWLREQAYSTGLGHGFAIPHAKSGHVLHPTLCLARLERPVDWGASDGQPVDMVLLLAFNAADAGAAHLKFFSRLARLVMHEDFRQALRAERDPERLLALLQEKLEGAA